MHLYLLRRAQRASYDELRAAVVRAPSHDMARKLASAEAGDEGAATWLNPKETSCYILKDEGVAEVLVTDFYEA